LQIAFVEKSVLIRLGRFMLGSCLTAALAFAVACGPQGNSGTLQDDISQMAGARDAGSAAGTITISGFAFHPSNLTVAAGSTVVVLNKDGAPHSVTSEATAGEFKPDAVEGVQFDTGPFVGTATFTIPADAPSGLVIPYFCTVHGSMMGTGTITIQ
jgi:plastocyanin